MKKEVLSCLHQELILRSSFGHHKIIETIYLGGGTPSLLSSEELMSIISTIKKYYTCAPEMEITLEANPDDLTKDYLTRLAKNTSINRLSIGIQSFNADDLTFMNRAHNVEQAYACLEDANELGFKNITADLIFGSQTTTDAIWEKNLKTMCNYGLPHLSIYGLSIEHGTALYHFVQTGKAEALDDDKFFRQFNLTQSILEANGYEQYEVSNYSKKGFRSKHNGNYWNQVPYLGIGPSAHSFDKNSRFWNVANNAKYIDGIKNGLSIRTEETLLPKDLYNELLLTKLRCIDGVSKDDIEKLDKKFHFHFEAIAEALLLSGQLRNEANRFYIPKDHRIFTDQITQELFYTDDGYTP